jgi:UbiD family decarboxylase
MALVQEPATTAGPRYRDLREWLEQVEAFGELKRISGARWDTEIGAIAELNAKHPPQQALLFDDVPGYPTGYRVLSASASTPRRLALTLRLAATTTRELVAQMRGGRSRRWQQESHNFPPQYVAEGPVFECVQEGAQVDLEVFPTPKWHELDGGRYIGTGDTA